MSTLRDLILSADDIPEETVVVPEWGDAEILVRGLTAAARSGMIAAAAAKAQADGGSGEVSMSTIYPDLVIATAYDPETRQLIFGPGDAAALGQKSGAATERIALVGMRLSGFMAQTSAALGKDSSKTESDDSSSS